MEDNKSAGSRNAAVLEGMYKGVAGKIDEVRQSFSHELQYSSAQQAYAYEALTEDYKRGIDTILAELRYISQQNSSIYEHGLRDRTELKNEILESVRAMASELVSELSAKVEERIEHLREELKAPAEAEEAPAEQADGAEQPAGEGAYPDDGFDYDVLAEKIATILPETDYDLLADKVTAALPQTDEQALADKIAAALPQTDEQALADRVAEAIPLTDYDLIAERVAGVFDGTSAVKLSDETVEKIAVRVVELLRGENITPVAPVVPAEEPQPAAPAPAAAPAASEEAPADGTEMTTRYKRSFVAKIIESEEDVKKYYSDLKNAILSYGKVRSQINWTNDRFSLGQDSVIKIGIRGKTLCVYLALDPSEFPETVYHQKFAGDTKMYEKTPMMVKIKSAAAVKRTVRLVDLLMERQGAVKEDREPVDYAAQYFFRTEEELLAEGLIKTAVVEKSDLNF